MHKPTLARLVSAPLLFLAVLLVAAWTSGFQETICEQTKGGEEQCARYNLAFFYLLKIKETVDHNDGLITALATIVIAAFTGTLWKSTRDLGLAGEKQMTLIEKTAAQQSTDMQASIKVAEDAAKAANRSAKLAEDALANTQNTARKELRAYLTVVPDGINQLIESDLMMGHVLLRNVGKLPARNVTLTVLMERSTGPEPEPIHRRRMFDVDEKCRSADRVLQPGAEMRQGSQDKIGYSELCLPDHNIYVFGIVNYEDGYGRPCYTRFCHRYATAGRNRGIRWERKPSKSRSFIDASKARYHSEGNSAEPSEHADHPT